MTPETLADLYYRLAERAWDRFKSRRGLELQTGIALWTAFGGGAAACITSRNWSSPLWVAVASTVLAIVVLLFYLFGWLPWLRRESFRDLATSYFWETHIQQLTGNHLLPQYLRPESEHEFPTVYQENATRIGGLASNTELRKLPSRLRRLSENLWMQFIVTVLFAFLFVASVWGKVKGDADAQDGVGVTIGNLKVNVRGQEGAVKVSVDGKEILISPTE